MIIKEQIKAENLSVSEEDYLCKLVLLSGDADRLKNSSVGPAPESEVKRAELEALARRYWIDQTLLSVCIWENTFKLDFAKNDFGYDVKLFMMGKIKFAVTLRAIVHINFSKNKKK